jgi:hypothetical protein
MRLCASFLQATNAALAYRCTRALRSSGVVDQSEDGAQRRTVIRADGGGWPGLVIWVTLVGLIGVSAAACDGVPSAVGANNHSPLQKPLQKPRVTTYSAMQRTAPHHHASTRITHPAIYRCLPNPRRYAVARDSSTSAIAIGWRLPRLGPGERKSDRSAVKKAQGTGAAHNASFDLGQPADLLKPAGGRSQLPRKSIT